MRFGKFEIGLFPLMIIAVVVISLIEGISTLFSCG